MIVHRFKASAFKSIGDPISLELPEEGRIGILGPNESGKTTLLEAIEYSLYGLRRGRAAEESRENIVTWGKEEARLETEFTSGQERYLLRRAFDIHGGHKARLTPIVDGKEDSANALSSLTEIEARIEQITGMDRDSFTKLVYVKQKDLDALKELAKARREQLVNKVMGIEVFDDAVAKAKLGVIAVEKDLEKRQLELESVRRNAQAYEEKLAQKDKLQTEIVELRKSLQEKDAELGAAENLLKGYDWLSAYTSSKGLVDSTEGQRSRIQQDIEAAADLRRQMETYRNLLAKLGPEVEKLERLRTAFLALQSRLEQSQSAVSSLRARENEVVIGAGLSGKERELLIQDPQARKQRQLVQFTLALVLCVALIAIAAFSRQFIVGLLALLCGVSAVKFYRTYQRIDRILGSSAEILAVKTQLADETRRLHEVQREIDSLTAETGIKGLADANLVLSGISNEIKQVTGQTSIQAVDALRQNVHQRLKELNESDPAAKLQQLDRQLAEKTMEIERLEQAKPPSADKLQYDKDQHETAKQTVEALRKGYGDLDGELRERIGTVSLLEADLQRLMGDFNRRPSLEADYTALDDRKKVLELVVHELGETSRELRGRVIPHASFIINQILPTLTDGRYSQFEITEDLRFKAYSGEARSYKEREVFSGGTQDQFLIALRLAFTQSVLDSRVMADKYSLLMDECISSSDDQRKQGIFEVLQAMKKTLSQIFIIAHEDISNFVDHYIVLGRSQQGYTQIRSKSW